MAGKQFSQVPVALILHQTNRLGRAGMKLQMVFFILTEWARGAPTTGSLTLVKSEKNWAHNGFSCCRGKNRNEQKKNNDENEEKKPNAVSAPIHLLRRHGGEDGPQFGHIGGESNVDVDHDDFGHGGRQDARQRQLQQAVHARVVFVGNPGDVGRGIIGQIERYLHCEL